MFSHKVNFTTLAKRSAGRSVDLGTMLAAKRPVGDFGGDFGGEGKRPNMVVMISASTLWPLPSNVRMDCSIIFKANNLDKYRNGRVSKEKRASPAFAHNSTLDHFFCWEILYLLVREERTTLRVVKSNSSTEPISETPGSLDHPDQ
jgi:hypothetical protein